MKLLTVNLEKKLIGEKQKQIAIRKAELMNSENMINQAELILNESTKQISGTLEGAGFGLAIKNAKHVINASAAKKAKLESLKNERIFTLSEIKKLALDYGLRFLPTTYYKGDIPSDLAGKIKEVETIYGKPEIKEKSDRHRWESQFRRNNSAGTDYPYMILAPESSFELQERPKDPLLFRSLPDGSFYLVHKWGSDLSALRYISYSFSRGRYSYFTVGLLLYFFTILIFGSTPGYILGITLASIFIMVAGLTFPGISFKIEEYEESWNSPYTD